MRGSYKDYELIEKEIKEMLMNGIVRPSNSPWASQVVLVVKKDNSIRFLCGLSPIEQYHQER